MSTVVETPVRVEVVGRNTVKVVDAGHLKVTTEAIQGPQGVQGLVGANSWESEVPGGALNGVNAVFTTSVAYISGNILVFLNGIMESHFSESSSTTITMSSAPLAGDELVVFYKVA